MRRIVIVALLVASAGAVTWAARVALESSYFDTPRQQHAAPAQPIARAWMAPTEQEWIVTDIVGAIDGIARRSPDVTVRASLVRPAGRMTAANTSFDVTIEGATHHLPIVGHVWSPDMYAPLALRLLGDAPPPAQDADLGVRHALVARNVAALLAENTRISSALEANIRSASAHEAAALLVGAMELREPIGIFMDVRPALSRMAAHLAVAEALRGTAPAGPDGQLALIVLTEFAGLERQAIAALDRFDTQFTGDADRAWSRALRLRITHDWRAYDPAALRTPLEQIEYGRTLAETLDDNAVMNYLDTYDPPSTTEWSRNALVSGYMSVEAGHRFAPLSLQMELSEAAEAWRAFHDGDVRDPDVLLASLNERADPTPLHRAGGITHVQVLDWGRWAEFAQRQLCESLIVVATHAWNLRGDAGLDGFRKEVAPRFEGLTLFPVVARWAGDLYTDVSVTDYEHLTLAAWPIAERTPELLTPGEWNYLLRPPHGIRAAARFPLDVAWFEPGSPLGTAFDLSRRSLQPNCRWHTDADDMNRWADEQPFDYWTQWSAAWLPVTGKPTAAAVRKRMGTLLEYHVQSLRLIYQDIPLPKDERITVARKMCDLVPAYYCGDVGHLLLLDGREPEAAEAFQQWVRRSRDHVVVSNDVQWLVRYYRDTGRMSEAHTLAEMAGDTGSSTGMRTFGEQLEVEGHPEQAQELYQSILDSYDNSVPLGTFLLKQARATHDKALEGHAFDLLRPMFPDGMQRPQLNELDAAPADGAVFQTFGRRAANIGFEPGDIIVMADGWRVRNYPQLIEAMRLTLEPAASFVVWRGGRYRELHVMIPQRLVGVNFANYTPPVKPQ